MKPIIKHFELPDKFKVHLDATGDTYSMVRKFMAKVADAEDKVIEESIIEYAEENHYTDLLLIDEEFVKTALKKQIPKKPQSFDSVPLNRCPTCHDIVRVFSHSMKLKFCCWCGQALDWSDDYGST